MYIKAIIKNKDGKIFEVKADNNCKIVIPKGVFEQAKYAYATNFLLWQFYRKLKPYANENYAIVEIVTDNALVAEKMHKEGLKVSYLPCEVERVEA